MCFTTTTTTTTTTNNNNNNNMIVVIIVTVEMRVPIRGHATLIWGRGKAFAGWSSNNFSSLHFRFSLETN